jgi:DNA-binding Lrp family transcriptional regulator
MKTILLNDHRRRENMKNVMHKLLIELVKNSKRSDRELARIVGVSQPTVTRIRDKLERTGMIREYTVLPDFAGIGIEIAAFILVNVKKNPKMEEEATKWLKEKPQVVFATKGNGLGANCLVVSLHENYTEFLEFVSELRAIGSKYVESAESFVVSLKTPCYKNFSFSSIEKMKTLGKGKSTKTLI